MFPVYSKRMGSAIGRKADKNRLTTALIINEQNVIQTPVIEHPVYRKKVFHSLIFSLSRLASF